MWVRVKARVKSTFHAIMDHCIIGTYSVSPTFRPSLNLVLLSCESNEAEQFLCRGHLVRVRNIPEM